MRDLLECQGLVSYMRADHERIHKLVAAVRRAMRPSVTGSQRGDPAEVRERLATLLAQLRRHFADEEEGGVMEEAICFCPSLSHEATVLADDHPVLLRSLERILVRLNETPIRPRVTAEEEALVDQFASQLREHEAAENRLFSLALGGDFIE